MVVKTQTGPKVEAHKEAKKEAEVLVALGNGFKNYNRAGQLWTSEKPYKVSQEKANELLSIIADDRRPFVLFVPPPKKVEVEGVEVAQPPPVEAKVQPGASTVSALEKVKEIGSAEEAAELGLPPAGAQAPTGEKLVEV